MSVDRNTTQDLVKTAEDGKAGYAKGAEELEDSDRPELTTIFTRLSAQRATFSDELQALAQAYGDSVEEKGSAAAAMHRGWLTVRDALTNSGPESVLKTALQGEDHAIDAYERALKEDISSDTRTLVQRQLEEIKTARAEIQGLLDGTTT